MRTCLGAEAEAVPVEMVSTDSGEAKCLPTKVECQRRADDERGYGDLEVHLALGRVEV
jgi:hypothetical protein